MAVSQINLYVLGIELLLIIFRSFQMISERRVFSQKCLMSHNNQGICPSRGLQRNMHILLKLESV